MTVAKEFGKMTVTFVGEEPAVEMWTHEKRVYTVILHVDTVMYDGKPVATLVEHRYDDRRTDLQQGHVTAELAWTVYDAICSNL